jgi:hypothetical protein
MGIVGNFGNLGYGKRDLLPGARTNPMRILTDDKPRTAAQRSGKRGYTAKTSSQVEPSESPSSATLVAGSILERAVFTRERSLSWCGSWRFHRARIDLGLMPLPALALTRDVCPILLVRPQRLFRSSAPGRARRPRPHAGPTAESKSARFLEHVQSSKKQRFSPWPA